jgi:hypothetical protein
MAASHILITRDENGRPLRWRDWLGVVHAVERAPPTPIANDSDFPVEVWWTRCGSWLISRGSAWAGHDELTCGSCRAIECCK